MSDLTEYDKPPLAADSEEITPNADGVLDNGSDTMKALVWKGKRHVEVEEVPKPEIVEADDVIVAVTGSTICGSDLHLYHGAMPQLKSGDILGHEFCGRVHSMGTGVKKFNKGQRVVASFQIACGRCEFCKRKQTSQCSRTNDNEQMKEMYGSSTAAFFGYSHLTGGIAGGQAEYVRVPFAEVNLLPLPDSIPDERGLYLSDVLATAWHCVVDTGVKEGDAVGIWGAGPVGQMCAEYSFKLGAERVIVIDGEGGAWRLKFVKSSVPQVETLDFSQLPRGQSVSQELWKLVPSGLDTALECASGEYSKSWSQKLERMLGMETDSAEIVNELITSVKSFGRVGITGVYFGYANHFNIGSVMERGIRFIGNGQAPVHMYWEHLRDLIQAGEIEPLKMVTTRARLDDMRAVYEMYDKRTAMMQKIFVTTRFSDPPCPETEELMELEDQKAASRLQ